MQCLYLTLFNMKRCNPTYDNNYEHIYKKAKENHTYNYHANICNQQPKKYLENKKRKFVTPIIHQEISKMDSIVVDMDIDSIPIDMDMDIDIDSYDMIAPKQIETKKYICHTHNHDKMICNIYDCCGSKIPKRYMGENNTDDALRCASYIS